MTKARKVTVEEIEETASMLKEKNKDLETAKMAVAHYNKKLSILINRASAQTVKEVVKRGLSI